MIQTLYRFGVDPKDPTAKASTPVPIITNDGIEIVWSSWCDLIYTTSERDSTISVTYLGTSLNATQQVYFTSNPQCLNQPNPRQSLLDLGKPLRFFGTTMHEGVRGFVTSNTVTVFGTPAEKAEKGDAYRDVDSWQILHTLQHSFTEISMLSDNSLLVACVPKPARELERERPEFESNTFSGKRDPSYCGLDTAGPRHEAISCVADLQMLRDYCAAGRPLESLAQFAPTQLVMNATTATALDSYGRVYTRTTDPRYPACLGRPHTGTSAFEQVPYLSETRIIKVASGGYMTAAISEDGELFLWGQANPGTEGELGVLRGRRYEADDATLVSTFIQLDDVQDEDVKCLVLKISGENASAYDVAVGFGHILVAANSDAGQHVVFAAGCGDEGQLGIDSTSNFLEDFEEVVALRDKRIMQMVAAGWSSFVLADDR